MCGILGIVTSVGRRVAVDDGVIARMRDRMAHRGPDGAGLWRSASGHVALAHRRLAVIDPSPAGRQPMVAGEGRAAIVYNGELYNDAELREALAPELAARGERFGASCDTETVLWALRAWGAAGVDRMRGMYALGFYDAEARAVVLARDPLGIKPLYWWAGRLGGEPCVVFASEIGAILEHPETPRRPDLAGVSAYLTTIRTTLGERTLFEGVRCVRPGEVLRIELGGEEPRVVSLRERAPLGAWLADDGARPAERVREAVSESVRRHLRADVPTCCLLSGGLDSSVVATVAGRGAAALWTYCSGAERGVAGSPSASSAGGGDGGFETGDDFAFARAVASRLGTRHTEAPVSREMFRERWAGMVAAMGVPLSTPNEVAINEVARRLRADGKIVTLSGEGADELFAGYEGPMTQAARFVASGAGCEAHRRPEAGRFQLESNAWVPLEAKGAVLNEGPWRALEGDAALIESYRAEFAGACAEGEDKDPLQAHLRFHRRVNLAGLLLRLDSATMLAGVEGRTPLADVAVAALAESLPMREKFSSDGGRTVTKRVLREAFADVLPAEVVARPKASFPLPFQEWVRDSVGVLRESALARELFTAEAIETVAAQPGKLWHLAWPMVNVAMWGRRWWG